MRISNPEQIKRANIILRTFEPHTPIDDRISVLTLAINTLEARKRTYKQRNACTGGGRTND